MDEQIIVPCSLMLKYRKNIEHAIQLEKISLYAVLQAQ